MLRKVVFLELKKNKKIMTHRKLPDLELEYGSGSDEECEEITHYNHTITVFHHKSDDDVTRVARTEMAKQHLREVVLARRVAVDAMQTTMREIKKQSRRGAEETRGVVKARAIEAGRAVAEKYRKGSSGAIMMLLDRVATSEVLKILPPKVSVVNELQPSLQMHNRMAEVVALLDRVAPSLCDASDEIKQAVALCALPDTAHENWALFEIIRNEVAQEQNKCEYPLMLWLDVADGVGKRFCVWNDQHFFFVLWELAQMMIH